MIEHMEINKCNSLHKWYPEQKSHNHYRKYLTGTNLFMIKIPGETKDGGNTDQLKKCYASCQAGNVINSFSQLLNVINTIMTTLASQRVQYSGSYNLS